MNEDRVFAKCAWRLIPFIMVLYVANYLDRVNVGFAALTMNKDLGFSPSVYGFAAGIFFLSYAAFQVPACVTLERIGARRSVFCIMVAWGAVSAATAFVRQPVGFYILRFLLGFAEAGFFPGMMLYSTLWFPRSFRARFAAMFMAAVPLGLIVGVPLSGVILGMEGVLGFHGWQWLFLLEGLPSCCLAFVALHYLPDRPSTAAWLSTEEQAAIAARLAAEPSKSGHNVWVGLTDWRVLSFGIGLLLFSVAFFGGQLWLPQFVHGMGYSNFATGVIVALPYVPGIAAMLLWARSSDRKGERFWHIAAPMLFTATTFVVVSLARNDIVALVAISIGIVGLMAAEGPFLCQSASFLGGRAAASSIATINVLGTGIGGFIGPTLVGFLKEQTGDYVLGMLAMAATLAASAIVVLALGRVMNARPGLAKATASLAHQ